MLIAAIMEIVTSNCDDVDKALLKPLLPKNAETRDIAAAIEVIEEGGLHMDLSSENKDDDDGDKGIKGIGIKILDGATVLGLARSSDLSDLDHSDVGNNEIARHVPRNPLLQNSCDSSLTQASLSSAVIPGLWDDLHCEHVAVPFAAWALANWAMASQENRCRIQDLDQDGNAIMTTLLAPERSVKWHGSLVARLLLEDHHLPLNDSVPDWSSSLLSTIFHATKNEDISLALVALSAFLVSVERSTKAQKVVMDKGLNLLRDAAKHTVKHKQVQEMLAKALELLCTGDMQLSLEESQRWSGILLQWACGRTSSDTVRSSAIKILSHVLESHGPSSVAISQAWLAILLTEILGSNKISVKNNGQKKSEIVKAQVDQSNMHSAGQIANQLAGAVICLAGSQSGTSTRNIDTSPLADLLSLNPFVTPYKNQKKDGMPKIDAADSAIATLRGIKALAHLCSQDTSSLEKISDFGILCLLRRFLLCDDYEKLAAMEAYDASRVFEAQEMVQSTPSESSTADHKDQSSIRVPPTAHVRRHAAHLLSILSLLPNVKKAIMKDETWCEWLEECACGKLPGCNDLKIQSYARATLLNIFCKGNSSGDLESGDASGTAECPRYNDVIFFINPELPHWKCKQSEKSSTRKGGSEGSSAEMDSNRESLSDKSQQSSELQDPILDVVFVHGLRGGPYKTWRISEDKSSTKSGLVEKIDQEAGKQGTFWPSEWLSVDFPEARLFTLKYKTNLTQWSGASLPLQEVSSLLLHKLIEAGIGNRPVVFVTHSMGGLVVKQLLHKAKLENIDSLVKNTVGVVFYSCPHFGSKLADVPWRMGLVLRPAPSIGELRSGSPRLVELNDFIRNLHKKGMLDVLSFCETKVTPIVEGYGGWAFRMEIVPLESAYPGFGELVVLESTDHINSCKPLSRADPSYTEILEFLQKLKARYA
ncbi:hypothetical protein SAY86_029157 [Trapa natans]|uniref:Protein SERAC1 n=1 Tax=Trapa natans TaxID=22666 RepID=A0AAN7RFE1_TRANT|nr:hypothetical protein SAY86_029157 [Trapa natans]